MEILFIQLSDDVYISNLKKLTLKTGFVLQGHNCIYSCAIDKTESKNNDTKFE